MRLAPLGHMALDPGASILRGAWGSEDMDVAMRVAVVDIGTNSTRLLIADVEGTGVEEVERRTTVTNMGRGVDHTGLICHDAIDDVCAVVADYKARYEEMGAERVMAIATSAVRDAVNGEAFIAELRERFGLDARLLTGEEEAHLTYLGATAHRQTEETTLVFDIGGGSTELVVGSGKEVGFHTSLQAGTIRQSERHLTSDPPDPHELEDLAADIRNLIDRAIAAQPSGPPVRGIARRGNADLAGGDRPGPRSLRPDPCPRLPPGAVEGPAIAEPALVPAARRAPSRAGAPARACSDHRGGHGHPRAGDAGLRPAGDRGLRTRHPARLGPLGRDGTRLRARLAG